MSCETYLLRSEEEMLALGQQLAQRLPARAVLLLMGNLGAGKTTLAKGIVSGLGVALPEEVSSPTFTLIHEYGDPVRVYHIDLYRLEEPQQLLNLGLEEIFERRAVTLVEWADRFANWMPPDAIRVEIENSGPGEESARLVRVTGLA
ncbi:MAG: tRNA (adenosine(37)-N6)-threonylcarbamoyltransferase complex ATPase subunit type 1 TsaE [Bryobacteraceae bacterium]|nr:tRNA (adenosine(37)-N6)-threonylcarbamoyltransferase complex ATPase subunit type 1 TsaE [Bryobacteraceae bacterium]MDW8378281.1 tRNA (adenosine(37)-N6)-threonylcarbamoyltransferase complex ATPase subunit type 1 TsaE [Bryobacterales bacterium]